MKTLWILRGLPNSGKTTIGEKLAPGYSFAGDDFFYQLAAKQGKTYTEVWNPDQLWQAHEQCLDNVARAMSLEVQDIAVTNTFVEVNHIRPYQLLANKYGYRVHIMTVERSHEGDNGHQVPETSIQRMVSRWQAVDKRFCRTNSTGAK